MQVVFDFICLGSEISVFMVRLAASVLDLIPSWQNTQIRQAQRLKNLLLDLIGHN